MTACVAVFILGLAAHAYGFLNLTISHDSLQAFYLSEWNVAHKIRVGRFMNPIYQLIFCGRISLPWLNGLLSLCWLSVSVWMTAYIFSITDKFRITLVAGIFSVNITVTALAATYMHDLGADMFAVMCAVGMVFLWFRGGKALWLGVPFCVLVLGLYQSMISVSITLIMFSSILALLQGKKSADVVRKGLQALSIFLIAGIIYFLTMKLTCWWARLEMSTEYNSPSRLYDRQQELCHYFLLLKNTYHKWYCVFTHSARAISEMQLLHMMLVIPAIIAAIQVIFRKSLPVQNKLLVLILVALLPLGMNVSFFLSDGVVHDLMLYAAWLTYLLMILISDWHASVSVNNSILSSVCRVITALSLVLILAANVQTANCAYVKKHLERQATLALMMTVNGEMNKVKGYVAGETEVVFIGKPRTGFHEEFQYITQIIGMWERSPITYTHYAYFKYILQAPMRTSYKKIPESFTNSMKPYPQEGYIRWYGDTLVVKLSN